MARFSYCSPEIHQIPLSKNQIMKMKFRPDVVKTSSFDLFPQTSQTFVTTCHPCFRALLLCAKKGVALLLLNLCTFTTYLAAQQELCNDRIFKVKVTGASDLCTAFKTCTLEIVGTTEKFVWKRDGHELPFFANKIETVLAGTYTASTRLRCRTAGFDQYKEFTIKPVVLTKGLVVTEIPTIPEIVPYGGRTNCTISLGPAMDGTIVRTNVQNDTIAYQPGWVIIRNGVRVLSRNAGNEFSYRYHIAPIGDFTIYVDYFIGGSYKIISNAVSYRAVCVGQ